MSEPSEYERQAWENLDERRSRPLSGAFRMASEKTAEGVASAWTKATEVVDAQPRLSAARGKIAEGGRKVATSASRLVGKVPDGVKDWSGRAAEGTSTMANRVARVGLTADGAVKKYVKAGCDITTLSDVRKLDLQVIDRVRGRNLDLAYAAAAAASGAGTATLLTGGVIAAGGGVTAAPAMTTIAGAMVVDVAAVLGITSRAVGHVSLLHGYDPEDPVEKLVVAAVINLGSAATASARGLALRDLSRLTQGLYRGASWAKLNESVISRALAKFAEEFGGRFTKKTLAKVVPGLGIVLSAGMNWALVEGLVDEAIVAYRRRLLLEKYPQLKVGTTVIRYEDPSSRAAGDDDGLDDNISLIEIIDAIVDEGESEADDGAARA